MVLNFNVASATVVREEELCKMLAERRVYDMWVDLFMPHVDGQKRVSVFPSLKFCFEVVIERKLNN